MKRWARNGLVVTLALGSATACAVGLGGPKPIEFNAMAIKSAPNESATDLASRINDANADVVLISAQQDSAWLAAVATSTGLELSGPSTTSGTRLAFLTRGFELLGDTSIVLGGEDSRIHMHDALYQVDEDRLLDLMIVRIDPAKDVSAVINELLQYEASDVAATASIVLALETPDPALADSISFRMRAAYETATGCAGAEDRARPLVRLLYRPPARLRCTSASVYDSYGQPVLARLVMGLF